MPSLNSQTISSIHFLAILIAFIGFEWYQRERTHAFVLNHIRPLYRRIIYSITLYVISAYGNFSNNDFIYFQF